MAATNLQRNCWIFAIAWMALIFYLSQRQSLPTPSLFPGQDKLFHGIFFGVLGSFYLGAMRKAAVGYTLLQVAIATLGVAIYGISDEIHQYFVPGRNAELMDILADTTGGFVAAMVLMITSRKITTGKP